MLQDHCYAPGQIWRNNLVYVRGYEPLIPAKFSKYPSSSSVVKADYVIQYIYMH